MSSLFQSPLSLSHSHSRNWILFSASPSRKITLATGPESRMHFSFHPMCVTVLAIPVLINNPITGWRAVYRSRRWCVKPGFHTGLDFSDVTPCSLTIMYGHFRGIVCLNPPRWGRRFHKDVDEYLPDSHNPENNYISTACNFTLFQAPCILSFIVCLSLEYYMLYTWQLSRRGRNIKQLYVAVRKSSLFFSIFGILPRT
jgi:hypothetical protein